MDQVGRRTAFESRARALAHRSGSDRFHAGEIDGDSQQSADEARRPWAAVAIRPDSQAAGNRAIGAVSNDTQAAGRSVISTSIRKERDPHGCDSPLVTALARICVVRACRTPGQGLAENVHAHRRCGCTGEATPQATSENTKGLRDQPSWIGGYHGKDVTTFPDRGTRTNLPGRNASCCDPRMPSQL